MKLSIIKKKAKDNKSNLYLQFYSGYSIDLNGKKKIHRKFEKLPNLFVYNSPKDSFEKHHNQENLQLAESIKSLKVAEIIKGDFKFEDKTKKKLMFLDYFLKKKEERYNSKGNYDNWDAAYKHLRAYCSKDISFENVDIDFVKGFRAYLDNKATTKSGATLAQNSKYTYYNKFKAALRQAYDEGILEDNIARKVKSFKQADTAREYLTFEELKVLAKTECKYPVLKRAFLFSCLSGLRWSDIVKLVWSEVRDEADGSKVNFRQKKTSNVEYLYISGQTRELLGKREGESERVFTGLKYSHAVNAELLRWVMKAGITKHITFHSGRHTFAVIMLEKGADIYTVSKILGHKLLQTTQIYAKIVDKTMKEASTIIPSLNI